MDTRVKSEKDQIEENLLCAQCRLPYDTVNRIAFRGWCEHNICSRCVGEKKLDCPVCGAIDSYRCAVRNEDLQAYVVVREMPSSFLVIDEEQDGTNIQEERLRSASLTAYNLSFEKNYARSW